MSLCFAIVSKTRHQVIKQLERLCRYCNCVVVLCHFANVSKTCHRVVKQCDVLDRYSNCVVVLCHCIDNTSPGGHTVRNVG